MPESDSHSSNPPPPRSPVHIMAIVRYDGSGFAGWQKQANARTVQGVIEEALSRLAGQPVAIQGAARTDAGVHALGQVFSCDWPGRAGLETLRHSLSRILSPSIRIEHIAQAPPRFSARHDAVGKRYAYTISLAREPDPFSARYAWRVPGTVEPARIAELAARLVGERDFAGFQCLGSDPASTIRKIESIEILPGGVIAPRDARDLWRIEFAGSGFLYKMIRNITGTLVDIARGHLPESRIEERLASRGPYNGYTAPPHGLTLVGVQYPKDAGA
ncbi:MAG TPA: tRNA pseudouridine(38-40) synthase TruA [Candidatus Hydrogenedentes bacterium]|nr:tRNA pseudouridine(38-40) synthase TruA [Candidatus Hydrogenedentota bacterium]HOV74855.1 tRNA pseudouridine(38-40) synthase TruA [Candidatus Hydrogenedentota bacterium]